MVGREGPIVQIGSALGSSVGQLVRVPESRLRLLVACGAAGGVSATFNAPIAGVFFALELILRNFETESFGVVVVASVLLAVIGRAAFGSTPFLSLPPFELVWYVEHLLCGLLGVIAAVVGIGFVRVLYGLEDPADWAWRSPKWLCPGVGSILLGLVLLVLPQMYGVATRCWKTPSAVSTRWASDCCCWSARSGDQPDDRHQRLGRRVPAGAIHGRHAGHGLRAGLVLPSVTLGAAFMARITRLVRSGLLDVQPSACLQRLQILLDDVRRGFDKLQPAPLSRSPRGRPEGAIAIHVVQSCPRAN